MDFISRGRRTSLALAFALLAGCTSMADLYEKEARAELAKAASRESSDTALMDDAALSSLPEPVRRYFRFAGFAGRKAPRNARIVWDAMRLKRGKDQGWMELDCRQINSVPEPSRIVLMRGRMLGILPFEGRDKFQDGHGHMLVKALGSIKVVDGKSRKLDESALVTLLAEALLVPSYALQPYLRWEAVDSTRARATLEWNGIRVSGIFHFDSSGACLRFETGVRWQQGSDSLPIPWTAHTTDYAERDGLRFPRKVSAVWHERAGDFEYVQGRIDRIEFDVREP